MFILCASQRKIKVQQSDVLVSDSVNVYPVKFSFTAEWKGLTKTVSFRTIYNKKVEKKFELLLDETNICNIPWELLLKHDRELQVGVYGSKGDDLIMNTIWQPLGKIYEGVKNIDADNHPEEPTPDVYQQILSQMGNLEDLNTDDKSSLVGAINEVYQKIDSGIGEDGHFPAGVTSFNGRSGVVNPQTGDYTYDMVGAVSLDDFADLKNEIPKKISNLENDENFVDKSYVDTTVGNIDILLQTI